MKLRPEGAVDSDSNFFQHAGTHADRVSVRETVSASYDGPICPHLLKVGTDL